MITTASSSHHLSIQQSKSTQINELYKQLMHQSLADDPMDQCKHQLMLKQAPSHTRTSLCDAHTAQSEQQ
jgi:hypothetical protein